MQTDPSAHLALARRLAGHFAAQPAVEAIAIAGSLAAGSLDRDSDIDLYVYTTGEIPLATRQAIVEQMGASRADLDLQFWGPGDEWFDAETGIEFDIIFALDRLPHPGEKRLLASAESRCKTLPDDMASQVEAVLRAVSIAGTAAVDAVDALLDGLDTLLRREEHVP